MHTVINTYDLIFRIINEYFVLNNSYNKAVISVVLLCNKLLFRKMKFQNIIYHELKIWNTFSSYRVYNTARSIYWIVLKSWESCFIWEIDLIRLFYHFHITIHRINTNYYFSNVKIVNEVTKISLSSVISVLNIYNWSWGLLLNHNNTLNWDKAWKYKNQP